MWLRNACISVDTSWAGRAYCCAHSRWPGELRPTTLAGHPNCVCIAHPAGPAAGPTFVEVLQRCRAGFYDSPDALRADAAAATDLVRGLAEEAQHAEQAQQAKRGRQPVQPSHERWWGGQGQPAGMEVDPMGAPAFAGGLPLKP